MKLSKIDNYGKLILRIKEGEKIMKRWGILIFICLLVFLTVRYKTTKSNNEEFLKKQISEFYEDEEIEFLSLEEIGDCISLIFYKVKGEYEYSEYEDSELVLRTVSLSSFEEELLPYRDADKPLLIVFSDGTELAKVQITVNEEDWPSQKIEIDFPTMTVFDLNLPVGTDYFEME